MDPITFTGVPTFRIHDVTQAKAFYIERLGFSLDWEHYYALDAPVYMQVSRDGLILHLSENVRFKESTIAFVVATGVESFRLDVVSRTNEPLPELEHTPWGTTQLEIEDPFGNLLRFNQDSAD